MARNRAVRHRRRVVPRLGLGPRLLLVPLVAVLSAALLWPAGAGPAAASASGCAPAASALGLPGVLHLPRVSLPAAALAPSYQVTACEVPDNGGGTADLPPPGCPYVAAPGEKMVILDGLPPGDTIDIVPTLHSYTNVVIVPGGTLGGGIHTFDAVLTMDMAGTGSLGAFARLIHLPVTAEIHSAPRNPGEPVQTFATDLFRLQGTIVGDPDFDPLHLTAGQFFGLPSPGQATLTRQPSGDFAVDSFFDVTYQIDFVGAPGSQLDSLLGTTIGTVRMQTERRPVSCLGRDNWQGTVDLPPEACHYEAPPADRMQIIDGLPPGDDIEIDPTLHSYSDIVAAPGGTLGGEVLTFDAVMTMDMVGHGSISPFARLIDMPVTVEIHTAPRTPGDPVQTFFADLFMLHGIIAGDPDFDSLELTAGPFFGLPSPGLTTLYELPSGDYAVDSFFDVTYQLSFVGAPGSQLDSLAGTTTGTVRLGAMPFAPCLEYDNRLGTVDLPPGSCPYRASRGELMYILDGLPPGDTIEIDPTLHSYATVVVQPGGTLGGEMQVFDATLTMDMVGTGALAGWSHLVHLPVAVEMHSAPRTPGDPVQSFATVLFQLQAPGFPGDPQFSDLQVIAGTNLGLPSPGQTTLTELPSGDFAVDSFFDVTYRIDFVGAPGSQLDSLAGSTVGTVRLEARGIAPLRSGTFLPLAFRTWAP